MPGLPYGGHHENCHDQSQNGQDQEQNDQQRKPANKQCHGVVDHMQQDWHPETPGLFVRPTEDQGHEEHRDTLREVHVQKGKCQTADDGRKDRTVPLQTVVGESPEEQFFDHRADHANDEKHADLVRHGEHRRQLLAGGPQKCPEQAEANGPEKGHGNRPKKSRYNPVSRGGQPGEGGAGQNQGQRQGGQTAKHCRSHEHGRTDGPAKEQGQRGEKARGHLQDEVRPEGDANALNALCAVQRLPVVMIHIDSFRWRIARFQRRVTIQQQSRESTIPPSRSVG